MKGISLSLSLSLSLYIYIYIYSYEGNPLRTAYADYGRSVAEFTHC